MAEYVKLYLAISGFYYTLMAKYHKKWAVSLRKQPIF
jgi:hypothetical protein